MRCRKVAELAIALETLSLMMDAVLGALTISPQNTVVVVGQPVNLTCRTDLSGVAWQFTDAGDTPRAAVYSGNTMNPNYAQLNVTVTTYDLIFPAIRYTNAGTYTCQDANGRGQASAAWVSVLASEPRCWPNGNFSDSNITLTCNLIVYGRNQASSRLRPALVWTCSDTSGSPQPSIQTNGYNETWTWTISPSQSEAAMLSSSLSTSCNATIKFTVVSSDYTIDPRTPNYSWSYPPPPPTTAYATTTGAVSTGPTAITSSTVATSPGQAPVMTSSLGDDVSPEYSGGGGRGVTTANGSNSNATPRIGASGKGHRDNGGRLAYVTCLTALFLCTGFILDV